MKDSWLPGVRMPCQLCRVCASLRRPASSAKRGCSPFRWTAWTVKMWGRHWENRGLPVRSGLHCAPLAHRSAGTLDVGTVRVSFSAFNSSGDVDALAGAVARLPRRQ